MTLEIVCSFFVLALASWWTFLLLWQAKRFFELETQLGVDPIQVAKGFTRAHRIIVWESTAFLGILLFLTLVLFFRVRHERKRTFSLHTFFASMTHELKTPLTSIRLQAESSSSARARLPILNKGLAWAYQMVDYEYGLVPR